MDVLPPVCKQGVGGSSPPSSTWENDPGWIIKEAIDTSWQSFTARSARSGLPVLAIAVEAIADLAEGFPLRLPVLVRLDPQGHGQPGRPPRA
ncbi:MAG TPA: hypothetical protein VEG33_13000 [Streptosporangiaceae bacterium]|nr:hypothetical protein [Streptosporangiaceae bacterium]